MICVMWSAHGSCLRLMNSAYSIFKRPAHRQGQPFLEVVLQIPGAGHYTPNLAQEINLSRNQRRINVDRVSISGLPYFKSRAKRLPIALVANNIAPVTMRETTHMVSVRRSSNADLYSRCFRYLDCFNGGWHSCYWNGSTIKRTDLVGSERTTPTFKAIYLSNLVDRSQLRMSEDSNLMCNQNQALTTPVNLVGGALTCEPYLPLVGPKPPCKGGSYARI